MSGLNGFYSVFIHSLPFLHRPIKCDPFTLHYKILDIFPMLKNVAKGNKETDLKSNEFSFYEIESNQTLIIIY